MENLALLIKEVVFCSLNWIKTHNYQEGQDMIFIEMEGSQVILQTQTVIPGGALYGSLKYTVGYEF